MAAPWRICESIIIPPDAPWRLDLLDALTRAGRFSGNLNSEDEMKQFDAIALFQKTGVLTQRAIDQIGDYQNAVINEDFDHPCIHGHHGCAAWDNGPCLDELMSAEENA